MKHIKNGIGINIILNWDRMVVSCLSKLILE